jgi:hypothetical protein
MGHGTEVDKKLAMEWLVRAVDKIKSKESEQEYVNVDDNTASDNNSSSSGKETTTTPNNQNRKKQKRNLYPFRRQDTLARYLNYCMASGAPFSVLHEIVLYLPFREESTFQIPAALLLVC